MGHEARAPFAADPRQSRGRLQPEPASPTRSDFQRDRDRIVHSTAFRRLKGKTQVFLHDEGDHYRTRLTHTIEVAQIARALARALRLDEDLAETLALAHDLGHPPFGHAGERALDHALLDFGGFDHNAQSLRLVTKLERRYPRFDGLNLTWETLEGLVKHNGPLIGPASNGGATVPFAIAEYSARQDLWLSTFASAEAQVAAVADDIAYNTHDIDDGLRAGLLTIDSLSEIGLIAGIRDAIRREHGALDRVRETHELSRRLITAMIEDVIAESFRRLDALRPENADDIRHASTAVVGFSAPMVEADRKIKSFLTAHVYRHERVMSVMRRAEDVVARLFARYSADPLALPEEWRPEPDAGADKAARRIGDYLAGMTDRYALTEYERLFGAPANLG